MARIGVVLFLALKMGSVLKASIDTGLLLQLLVFMRKSVLGLRHGDCALSQDLPVQKGAKGEQLWPGVQSYDPILGGIPWGFAQISR